jgi:hypothetical protein
MKKATVGAVAGGDFSTHSLPAKASLNWINDLQRLQPLEADLALLPFGWGRKIPTNANSHVIYDLAACEEALSTATCNAAYLEQDALGSRLMETAIA